MANHKSAIKRNKQAQKKRSHNRSRRTMMRTIIKRLRTAIANGEKDQAKELLVSAQSVLAKLAKTGVIKDNHASRKTSRLASQVSTIK